MRELKPYRTLQGLRKAIDNGGRFYNFLTDADDHVVTRAELAKAAGVFTAGVNAFLFLELHETVTRRVGVVPVGSQTTEVGVCDFGGSLTTSAFVGFTTVQ